MVCVSAKTKSDILHGHKKSPGRIIHRPQKKCGEAAFFFVSAVVQITPQTSTLFVCPELGSAPIGRNLNRSGCGFFYSIALKVLRAWGVLLLAQLKICISNFDSKVKNGTFSCTESSEIENPYNIWYQVKALDETNRMVQVRTLYEHHSLSNSPLKSEISSTVGSVA